MTPCLDLPRFLAGTLTDEEHADFKLHLAECAGCRVRLKIAMARMAKEDSR